MSELVSDAALEQGGSVADERARRGLFAAVFAFTSWGVLPLYLRALKGVPPLEILANRVVYCFAFLALVLGARGEFARLRLALATPRTRRTLIATSLLITLNWSVYVWCVSTGRVVEASLGYFINPLANVLLGVLVLRERLTRANWVAVALATLGVAWLAYSAGGLPYPSLALAFSFSIYGLLRKLTPVDATVGLAAETTLLTPFALAFLAFYGDPAPQASWETGLLVLSGVITAVPLALFAYAAQRIPYTTVGLMQYLAPTLQFLIGVFVFREPFDSARLLGYVLIWAALALSTSVTLMRSAR